MFEHILLAVDLESEDSWRKALPVAVSYAEQSGATLHVMTVVPDFGMSIVGSFFPKDYEEKVMKEANRRLHEFVKEKIPTGIKVQHIVSHGTAYEEILHMQGKLKCDLIVMGAHRPKMQDYLLGPNAARVVRHANCSVLVVRDEAD
ncbi:universal stress protein [Sneathiella chinensis]|uniref:Universal stress protein n=1 Tax=Sneathiella chinensis TaxID=349750 RepID=A0ABQ5U2A1_9PROT|nr:universal stress protein [Sneathiella chinensis]GLQ05795.1 universal stress protein UspA [Sneathiella chinensis]